MSEWYPIETAPKDGTRVLLFYPKCGEYGQDNVIFGEFDSDKYAKNPRPFWSNDRRGLYGTLQTRAQQPTHWMPLPGPPK